MSISSLLLTVARSVAGFFYRIELWIASRSKPQLADDEQWESWLRMLARINAETTNVLMNRRVYRDVEQLFHDNPRLQTEGGFVWHLIRGAYGRDASMAIRREIDRDTYALNLIELMHQIIRRPNVISRQRYLAHFPADTGFSIPQQNDRFDALCGTGRHIDLHMVKQDRNRLERACQPVVRYVNQKVAHRTDEDVTLNIAEIDYALTVIEDTVEKYYSILSGAALMGAERPVSHPWRRMFTYAWMPGPKNREQ
jgi:hypothetical protein